MALRTKVSLSEVLSVIPQSKGQIQPIEKALQCTRSAVKEVLANHPEAQQELADELERQKDIVMINLIADAQAGDPKARELLMKAVGRDRGFGDKLEVTGKDGAPMVILHAAAQNLIANDGNGNASKQNRIASWEKSAIDYHEQQTAAVEAEIVEDKKPVKTVRGRRK